MSDVNWTDLIQSVGVIAALLFTSWEMYSRRREQRFQSYLTGMTSFVDLARLMIERPELHDLYQDSDTNLTKTYEQMSPQEKAKIHYCDTIIALCETVWLGVREGLAVQQWHSDPNYSVCSSHVVNSLQAYMNQSRTCVGR
jgi:hypothetical protein